MQKCWRIFPKIYHHIQYRTCNTPHHFDLAEWRQLIMHSSHRTLQTRKRMIHLHPFFCMTDLRKFIFAIGPAEPSATVPDGLQVYKINAFQLSWVKDHLER